MPAQEVLLYGPTAASNLCPSLVLQSPPSHPRISPLGIKLRPESSYHSTKKELNQSNPAHRSITALLPHHHRRKKHPPVRTQGLREQTAFSRTRISLPEKPIAPVLHWLITDFSRDLLYHLRGNHASRTNPMIPQQVTVDTFPQELFPCLPRAFSFAPSKEQR